MDKASSVYLDKFAVDKLLAEKLEKVSHTPGPPVDPFRITALDSTSNPLNWSEFRMEEKIINFPTPCPGEFEENNRCRVDIYPAEKEKGRLIFVHGLYEENRSIYQYLFMLLNKRGYTVFLYIMPYHYERKPVKSLFSGEYFWSADFQRSAAAFKQSVEEVYLLYRFLEEKYNTPPHLCGFSMGATVLFNLAAGTKIESRAIFLNPVVDIPKHAWTSRLWKTLKEDYIKWDVPFSDVQRSFSLISPSGWSETATPEQNLTCICGEYDRIADSRDTALFLKSFKSVSMIQYKCGHLNMLRVPRLAEDMEQIFTGSTKDVIL